MSDVLAVAEHRGGELRDVSLEVISAGRELTEETGGELHLVVVGNGAERLAEDLNRVGVDVVHAFDDGTEFNHDVSTQVIEQLAAAIDPRYILIPHSVNGLDYAPAVATRLQLPILSDAVALALDDGLTVTREEYGGKVETTLAVADRAVLTIRPTEWPVTEEVGDASIEPFEATIDESAIRSSVNGFEEATGGDVDITESDFLISIGRGIEEEENLPLITELVEVTGATLSSSRPIVDNGWLPKNRQVGQSGKVVTPSVYVAIGISGAVQHVAGMKGADTIIAINTDPAAPIFDIADYGIVGDLFEVVPALIEEFE